MKPIIRFISVATAAILVVGIGSTLVLAQMPAPTSPGPSTTVTTPPTPTAPDPDPAPMPSPTPPPRRPVSTVTVPASGQAGAATRPGCPPGGEAPGDLFVVFAPGTPANERAAAHAAAQAAPLGRSNQEIAQADGSVGVTVNVPVGMEVAALRAYRSRPTVRLATRVVIPVPVCPSPPPSTGQPPESPPPTTSPRPTQGP